jgi:hypothetical protein
MSVAVAVDKDNNDIINDDDDDTTINFQVAVKVNQRIDDAVDGDDGVGNESQTNNACPTTAATTRTNNNLLPKFSIICRICHTNDVPERLGLSVPVPEIISMTYGSRERICFYFLTCFVSVSVLGSFRRVDAKARWSLCTKVAWSIGCGSRPINIVNCASTGIRCGKRCATSGGRRCWCGIGIRGIGTCCR